MAVRGARAAIRRLFDRIALFRAARGLHACPDHTFDDEKYNTYAYAWPHNLTAALCSFRAAKTLRRDPGSRTAFDGFVWQNSIRFTWSPQQLLDLGLMEPGQWS